MPRAGQASPPTLGAANRSRLRRGDPRGQTDPAARGSREEARMGALDGVRVVDFGQWIAGPLAAMLLADQGAEVVRVDPPGGPRWATAANAAFNRGKASATLDLKTDRGRDGARRLLDTADV